MFTATIIILGLILTIVIIVAIVVAVVISKIQKVGRTVSHATSKVKSFSKAVYGTEDILEGIQRQEFEHATTPKSVASMTNIQLPKITRDFKDFNFEEMRERAKNVLSSYLFSIDERDPSHLSEGNNELRNNLEMQLKLLADKGYTEHFERIKIHKCEISDYKKQNGRCIVTFQMSVQYFHYILQGDVLKTGRKDRLTQSRYNVDLIYIQDRNMVENVDTAALGINCPNCGAPISALGTKVCAYCGTPIIELNLYAWTFADVKEIK